MPCEHGRVISIFFFDCPISHRVMKLKSYAITSSLGRHEVWARVPILHRLPTSVSESRIERQRAIESLLIGMQYISFSYVEGHTTFSWFEVGWLYIGSPKLSCFIRDLRASFRARGHSRTVILFSVSGRASLLLPHWLAYKIHVLVRASPISRFLDWSYTKGGLIAQFRHTKACNPYFV